MLLIPTTGGAAAADPPGAAAEPAPAGGMNASSARAHNHRPEPSVHRKIQPVNITLETGAYTRQLLSST